MDIKTLRCLSCFLLYTKHEKEISAFASKHKLDLSAFDIKLNFGLNNVSYFKHLLFAINSYSKQLNIFTYIA